MGIRKDEMIQVTTFSKETIEKIQVTVAEAQKKQTLTYKSELLPPKGRGLLAKLN